MDHPTTRQWIAAAASLLVLFVALSELNVDRHRLPEHAGEIFHHQVLRIGLDPSREPFAFFSDDAYRGLEVDLGYALGEIVDIPVQFIGFGYDGLYDALKTDQVDIVIAGLEPVYHIDGNDAIYSRHYFDNGLVLVTDNPDITSMHELPGHQLAYVFGSPADAEAHQWLRRVRAYDLRPFELASYAMDDWRMGKADAALVDATTAQLYLRQFPQQNVSIHYVTHQWYTIAIRADRPDIQRTINLTLHTLSDSGRLEAILNDWL